MEKEQQTNLVAALTEAYIAMPDKNLLAAYQTSIEPLLEGVPDVDRSALAEILRGTTALGDEEHSLQGLADFLDPPVGGF